MADKKRSGQRDRGLVEKVSQMGIMGSNNIESRR